MFVLLYPDGFLYGFSPYYTTAMLDIMIAGDVVPVLGCAGVEIDYFTVSNYTTDNILKIYGIK